MRVDDVADPALHEAAESLAQSLDMLLDRLADRADSRPRAGSAQWKSAWESRDTKDGERAAQRHLLLRIAIASLAGVNASADMDTARRCGIDESTISQASGIRSTRRPRRKVTHDNVAQLSMW
jgi:hypothetical protein